MTQSDAARLTPRHWIAFTALVAGLVATYLHLWKLGYMGPIVCTANHGCEIAMASPYGMFLGVDVALIGACGYALILVTAMIGIQPARINDRRITAVLTTLIITAFLFTLRLKYYEFFVLRTFCPWCAESALTITTHVIAVWLDWRRIKGANDF